MGSTEIAMLAPLRRMKQALDLTRSGRLAEATGLIRSTLTRRPGSKEQDAPPPRPSATGRTAIGHGASTVGTQHLLTPTISLRRGPSAFSWHEVRCDAGSRRYKLHVPAGCVSRPMALVVMLHGCAQTPDDFAVGTRMNELADEMGFLVAYPEQTASANMSRCWNWFKPSDQVHGRGEPAIIAEIARRIMSEHQVASDRVFVAGLSAGGAAAAIMGQAYPDLFAGVGAHSGLACGAAHDMTSAFAAMRGGGGSSDACRHAMRTIVFHGSADRTVHPGNAARIVRQAGAVSTSSESGGRSVDGTKFIRHIYDDAAGRPLVEEWSIEGAGHAWSGGSTAGSYTSISGPDASREMLRFFGID